MKIIRYIELKIRRRHKRLTDMLSKMIPLHSSVLLFSIHPRWNVRWHVSINEAYLATLQQGHEIVCVAWLPCYYFMAIWFSVAHTSVMSRYFLALADPILMEFWRFLETGISHWSLTERKAFYFKKPRPWPTLGSNRFDRFIFMLPEVNFIDFSLVFWPINISEYNVFQKWSWRVRLLTKDTDYLICERPAVLNIDWSIS